MNHRPFRIVVGLMALGATLSLAPGGAGAHPLGNFSVNHLNSLAFGPEGIVNRAIVDFAEIPTAQFAGRLDAAASGETSAADRADFAVQRCAELASAQRFEVDGTTVAATVRSADFSFRPGAAGLDTGRLECDLFVAAELSEGGAVAFSDGFEADRVGWHEIVATAMPGLSLPDSPVGTTSVTDGLQQYPEDRLSAPLDIREASFTLGAGNAAASVSETDRPNLAAASPSVFTRWSSTLDDLVGRRDLTLGVGLLAVVMAIVLGASHALLPGHGKTVMAAYIAGRQGSIGDAVLVGATVTGTHTGGVLALGLALTLSTALAGEVVLAWLGVAGGVLVAVIGLGLLVGLLRGRPTGHGHSHGPHGHVHHEAPRPLELALVGAGGRHDRYEHDHDHDHHHDHDHDHDHDHHDEAHTPRKVSRRGLIGMGVAGGLVPSPSALVILLSAIALGRTWFGVVLVIMYGLGMAATLTAAGILLVTLRDRLQHRLAQQPGRARRAAQRWATIAPYATAVIVVAVGVGLTVRGMATL